MKMTNDMIDRINELVEDLSWDYEFVGIRVQEEPFELGELDHVSHVWVDGEDTGEDLDGVCALTLTSKWFDWARLAEAYFGGHAAIVCGNSGAFGEDAGEIIIEDPEVVEILA